MGILLGKGAPVPPGGGAPQPTLAQENGNLSALYGSVGQSDAAPTDAQKAAASDIDRGLPPLLQEWNEIKKSDLPAVNQQLHGADLPELRLDSPTEPTDADEE